MIGKVKNFNKEKGYGFIKTEEGKDVFFHYSELKMEGFKTVEANKVVEFELIETEKGLRAVNIVVVEE
ncbi:MAG: cold shock domain-containing protein [Bacilli bacterium]|nr:cold shock domain-containing protein [Bacilli bacterium]